MVEHRRMDEDLRTTHVGRLLLELSHDFVAEANRHIRERGFEFVRSPHIAVIAQIDEEGTELTTVVRRVGSSKQAVNKVLRQLEALDIIETRVSENDSRARVLRFTKQGRRFMKIAKEAVVTVEQTYTEILGEAAFRTMKKHLRTLAEARGVFGRTYDDELS